VPDIVVGADARLAQQLLLELLRALHVSTTALALYMIRFVVAMIVLPVMAEGIVNTLSRMGIALMLALFVAWGRPVTELAGLAGTEIGALALKEAALGLVLGFAMSTVFWVLEHVGALIDTAAGFNSVQLQNPMGSEQSTPVSHLLGQLAGAVFFSIGGAVFFAQAMFDSFQVWPLADLHPSAHGAYAVFVERQVGTLFSLTLKLAAPVLIIMMLIDVGVALLASSAEKLEPSSLAQPIKGIVTVLLVLLMIGAMFDALRQHLVPRGLVQQIAPGATPPPAAPR
jgi:type III secretion protein T